MRTGPGTGLAGWGVLALLGLAACAGPPGPEAATLLIQDQRQRPVFDAELVLGELRLPVDTTSRVSVPLDEGPVLGIIEAEGFLPEPVILGLEDAGGERPVPLWGDDVHWSMHVGGDVMLGRRYLAPPEGEPLLDAADPGPGAADVVAEMAPAFRASTLGMINLETVVGELPEAQAYPRKRFLLQMPPDALSALQALEVDAVDFANNHAYDWLDPGVEATLNALEEAELPVYGGGLDAESAARPLILELDGLRVGVLGFTSVDGSFVNNRYPTDDEAAPDPLDPDEAWQYERRSWGIDVQGLSVPTAERRAGTAWRLFAQAEDGLEPAVAAQAWTSLRAVYPELQDWVAGRGHGGAAAWRGEESRAAIRALDADVDVVVVQIHGGFQFSPGVSRFVDRMARDSVEAGADLVVAHHPHVLQGASFHEGTLVVHSLGNMVFDQDFLATFPSAFLRTVWRGDTLVEARLIPLELVRYRPTPVADAAARRTLTDVWERSRLGGLSDRVDGDVKMVAGELSEGSLPATLRIEGHTGLLLPDEPEGSTSTVSLPAGELVALPMGGLVDPTLGGVSGEIEVARDLFGWGRFEDRLADGRPTAATHWVLNSDDERIVVDSDGVPLLELERDGLDDEVVRTRSLARVPLLKHRLWSSDGSTPLDPEPRYAIRLRARASGAGTPHVRLTFYDFDDTDPTRDPGSRLVADPVIELDVGRRWRDVLLPVEPEWLVGADGAVANQVLPFVGLEPPRVGRAVLQVASIEVLELRRAEAMPTVPGHWTHVLNSSDADTEARVRVLGPPSP